MFYTYAYKYIPTHAHISCKPQTLNFSVRSVSFPLKHRWWVFVQARAEVNQQDAKRVSPLHTAVHQDGLSRTLGPRKLEKTGQGLSV